MTVIRSIATIALATTALAAAAPAAAVVETFATFSALTSAANIRFVNSGNSLSASRTTDAVIYSTATGTATTPGSVDVRFSFLQSAFVTQPAVQDIIAKFTFNASVARGNPITTTGAGSKISFDQPVTTGSFSFLTTKAITVTTPNFVTKTYAIGSNLLSGTFTDGDITGKLKGTSGGLDASTSSDSVITYTSDFLNFAGTLDRDLGMTFTSVTSSFSKNAGLNNALSAFRTNASGQFSTDPAPIIPGLVIVPEPAVWSLFVVGFGLIGFQTRRRVRSKIVSA